MSHRVVVFILSKSAQTYFVTKPEALVRPRFVVEADPQGLLPNQTLSLL